MNIEERKVRLAKHLLRTDDVRILAKVEQLLASLNVLLHEEEFNKLSIAELNPRIQESEDDFENGRSVSGRDLLAKYL